jgi:hypothetical protein
MSPVAGQFDFPEKIIHFCHTRGKKRHTKQSIRCVTYGYAVKTTPNSGCDMVSMMAVFPMMICKHIAQYAIKRTINRPHYGLLKVPLPSLHGLIIYLLNP